LAWLRRRALSIITTVTPVSNTITMPAATMPAATMPAATTAAIVLRRAVMTSAAAIRIVTPIATPAIAAPYGAIIAACASAARR
jgi:hypothetical protein